MGQHDSIHVTVAIGSQLVTCVLNEPPGHENEQLMQGCIPVNSGTAENPLKPPVEEQGTEDPNRIGGVFRRHNCVNVLA